MTIPFTQFLLPRGERRDAEIDRPTESEALAEQFIAAGGRYECEVLTTGQVSLTAVKEVDGEPDDIAIVICRNEPGVIAVKVDELVRQSIAALAATS